MSTLIPVKYIGHKDAKVDNIAGTGLVWRGHGDVQHVSPAAWSQLSAHPEVWRHAEDEDAGPPPARGGVVVATYDIPVNFGEITAVVDAGGNVMPLDALSPESAHALLQKLTPQLDRYFAAEDAKSKDQEGAPTLSLEADQAGVGMDSTQAPPAGSMLTAEQVHAIKFPEQAQRAKPGPKPKAPAADANPAEGGKA